MDNKIIETLENLEDRIESIKWLITAQFSLKKAGVSDAVNIIRKSAGILARSSIKGTSFENRIRKEWNMNFLKRQN